MKERKEGQGSLEQNPKTQKNADLNEASRASPRLPAGKPEGPHTLLGPEQQPHGGGINKPELHPPKDDREEQPSPLLRHLARHTEHSNTRNDNPNEPALPTAWDILERKARLSDEFFSHRITSEDYKRKRSDLDQLKHEIDNKGIDRDKHILALLYNRRPRLSLLSQQQQLHQLRSQVECLSDQDISECARRQKSEIAAFQRGTISILSFHTSAGDGERIPATHIAKKSKND